MMCSFTFHSSSDSQRVVEYRLHVGTHDVVVPPLSCIKKALLQVDSDVHRISMVLEWSSKQRSRLPMQWLVDIVALIDFDDHRITIIHVLLRHGVDVDFFGVKKLLVTLYSASSRIKVLESIFTPDAVGKVSYRIRKHVRYRRPTTFFLIETFTV